MKTTAANLFPRTALQTGNSSILFESKL